MKKLICYYGFSPEFIDVPKSCSRSVKGALHVLPKRPMTVTQEELEYIKNNRGDVYKKIRVISEMKDSE